MGTSLINDGFFIAMIAEGHSNPQNGSEIVMNSTFSIFLGVAITCYNHGEPTSSVGFFLNNPSPISATWNKWLPSRQGWFIVGYILLSLFRLGIWGGSTPRTYIGPIIFWG